MNPLIAVLIMATVTYIPRALPVAIFSKEIKSTYIKSFLYYVPYSVLSALTFPEIFASTGDYISAIVGTVVALILAFFKQSLVIVAIGAVAATYITQIIILYVI